MHLCLYAVPAVVGFHGLAFMRGGMTADAPRTVRVVCAIRSHATDLLIARYLVKQVRQHRCIPGVAAGDLN